MDALKKKCQNLESQRDLNEQTMNKYKEMLQKQKKENKELQDRVEELVQVKSDFKRQVIFFKRDIYWVKLTQLL